MGEEKLFFQKIHFFVLILVYFNNFYYLCSVFVRLAKKFSHFRFFTHILLYAIRYAETRANDARTVERDC